MNKLSDLLSQRFKLVERIAAYKFTRDIPAFQAKRESALLAVTAERASQLGINEQRACVFQQTLMALAVAWQQERHAYWAANGGLRPDEQESDESLEKTLRPQLDAIDEALLCCLARGVCQTQAQEVLAPFALCPEEQAALLEALVALSDSK